VSAPSRRGRTRSRRESTLRAAKKAAGDRPDIDGMTEVQVRERSDLDPEAAVRV
jgi:hypothetical protein